MKYTLILGANGYGKSTLCAIFRSMQSGEGSHVIGRKTLGGTQAPEVDLLLDNGNAQFKGQAWTRTVPEIAIFDGTFVAQNIHSGDIVDLEHKRNLYRVIIGEAGVALAEEEARLAVDGRAKTGEVTAAGKVLQAHLPAGMPLKDFLKLTADPEIDTKITEQEKSLEAIRQANQLRTRSALAEIVLPELSGRLEELLAKTLDDIAEDAEQLIAAHLTGHSMTEYGESWLAEGMPFTADDTCPFCGQSLQGLPLIGAYRAVFSEGYSTLRADIASLRHDIDQAFGAAAVGKLETLIAQNRAAAEFWHRYCTFDPSELELAAEPSSAIARIRDAALALIDHKARTPLAPVASGGALVQARAAYELVCTNIAGTNAAIRRINGLIAAKKAATEAAEVKAAEAALTRLKAIKKRHDPNIAAECTAYRKLESEKIAVETAKTALREKLEGHTREVVKPYEDRINQLLDSFNAGFQTTETKHGYPGGIATSSYQLVINNTAIELGDGNTPLDRPSFKNTLSAGDRTTLALAFFIAHLERDPKLASRIVVFDDPFTSQDAFRRRQTVHEIKRIGLSAAQVVVLSHDAGFLRHVWEKCPTDQRVALQIVDHRSQGTKLFPCDIAESCRGRTATEMDDLQAYLTTGAGRSNDVIKKMRVVLETYCRSTYPNNFGSSHNLGHIIERIRNAGDQHPACALLDELDQINDYSCDHHHGEDPADGSSSTIDARELTGFVRRTLKIVNALQA